MTARAFGYIRCSTETQRESGLGIDAQQATIEQTAARVRLPLARVFVDAGLSGSLAVEERPALVAALAELRKNDVLIVARRDRLARDVIIGALIDRAVSRKGARVLSGAGEGSDVDPNDPTAALLRRVIDAVAEYERLVIGARTRVALRQKRARGQRAGCVPYGHRVRGADTTLYPDEQEQRILNVITECRAAGYSLRDVAAELNRRGYTTRGGSPWRHQNVSCILATLARHAGVTGQHPVVLV